jgi:single-strand DNA-binding protein
MGASLNRVIIAGNLTRDPELRHIPSGTAVCNITVAVNDRVKRGDDWVDEATFCDVVLWSRTAEVANEYLAKGAGVLIEGRLKQESWEDKTSGQKRSKIVIVGEKMQMLGAKGEGGQKREPAAATVGDEDEVLF